MHFSVSWAPRAPLSDEEWELRVAELFRGVTAPPHFDEPDFRDTEEPGEQPEDETEYSFSPGHIVQRFVDAEFLAGPLRGPAVYPRVNARSYNGHDGLVLPAYNPDDREWQK